MIAGVDDAGRGPVIGPLVIAAVLFDEKNIEKLKAMRVKDSKTLSPKRRETLCRFIKETALAHAIAELPPARIDEAVQSKRPLFKLNRLEAETMAGVIAKLKPDIAYVDASDIDAERFGNWIRERLLLKTRVISEQKADVKYPVVAAASIVAKVRRDEIISELHKKYGFFGSGYPADPRTITFLERWVREHGELPEFARKSWETAQRIKKQITKR
ncbi:MAG TPA: ribonuclease HII [Hadesarchaea archaeon]|nr:ribonuclease HII [Hadesarchaea archaeon]